MTELNRREEVWLKAWVAAGGTENCLSKEVATKWADSALKNFDERFPANKIKDFKNRRRY